MSNEDTFYITTAIDYPNSVPHMGHAYEKVVADFYARAHRLRGVDTRFLIGLDEHGQKIQEAATLAGQSPREFVDEKAEVFRKLYDLLEISYDDFLRTSEPRHHRFCQNLWQKVMDQGDIYKGFYEGDYCISCERFYTSTELVDGKCPIHERATTKLQEESYFFRLGKYRERVLEHIERHPRFVVPTERRNEVVSRLREEVRDLSISRSTFDWGVPVPSDAEHVLYVWFEALSNYISALCEPDDLQARYWPASCHVIGKDITWFHSVVWPAMLLSSGYELPRQIYAHGFILDQDGRKMAKHLGNVVDPVAVIEDYSVEVLRFYFLRNFASGDDGRFSMAELDQRYHSELGNELGNLLLRIVKLVTTRLGGEIVTAGRPTELDDEKTVSDFLGFVDNRDHHRAVDVLWTYIKRINAYLNEKEPWKLNDEGQVTEVLGTSLEALRTAAYLLSPVMPETAKKVAASLGYALETLPTRNREPTKYRVSPAPALFPRRETPPATDAAAGEKKDSQDKKKEKKKKSPPPVTNPFAKLEITVGRIIEVEEHPDADSLYAMKVDVGEPEPRSICAGLRGHLEREELQDRRVLVLANLKPARLRGIESRGMVLASDRRDGAVVPVDPGEAPIGDKVRVQGIESHPKKKLSKSDFEKAPLEVREGRVTYEGVPLESSVGPIQCDAEDGAVVR